MIVQRLRLFLLPLLGLALLTGMLTRPAMANPSRSEPLATDAIAYIRGKPSVTSPGAAIPLHWAVEGGTALERTCVFWDTESHAYDYDYPYRTDPQPERGSRSFFDYVFVPQGAQSIFLRPYVAIDGEIIWGEEEEGIPTWRGIDAGSSSAHNDSLGRWWDPDLGYDPKWYGLIGGETRHLNASIAGTEDDWLYQRQREGLTGAGFWLTEGVVSMELEVSLHLAELSATAIGQRVFDVVFEAGTPDEVVISGVDVYARVGGLAALVISRTVTVHDYRLDVALVPVTGQPILNGVGVRGVSAAPQKETRQRVAYGDHDTYVLGSGNYRAASTVKLGGAERHHGGLRFFELQVPQGAVINDAYLWVTSAMTYYHQVDLTIYGDDVDHSDNFRSGGLVPLRDRTEASTPWSITADWRLGRIYQSPQLGPIIQEIVDRPGWRERNALTLLLIGEEPTLGGDPPREVWAVEGSYEDRAELIVWYTPRDVLPPTVAPTLTFTPTPTRTPTATATPTMTATPTATATPTPH